MKFGKIYDCRNKEEAKKLIGKKVFTSDVLYDLEKTTAVSDDIGTLVIIKEDSGYPFSVKFHNEDVFSYQFIREIEEDEPKRMTNRQLAEWCASGYGQITEGELIYISWTYHNEVENESVGDKVLIRYWGLDEWIEPTVDIYESRLFRKGE